MTNEERKNYLISWHRLLMAHHDAAEVDRIPDWQAIRGYKGFLEAFFERLYPLLPKKLYRYRSFGPHELENLRNGTAWFSHPDQFDDSLDTALNIDLEAEIEEVLGPNGDKNLKREFSISFITYLLKKAGVPAGRELVAEAFSKTEQSGFNEGMMEFFEAYLDADTSKLLLNQTNEQLDSICTDELKEAVLGWLDNYQDSNRKIRASVYELCLAEESDNDVMWGRYAQNCTGFCIEYEIPPDTFAGAMALSNLFPIYYGEKEKIRLVDILQNGVFNLDGGAIFEGIAQSDYEKMHVSSYTKSKKWEFQKEWRVTYGDSNLQSFPFATAIILGESIEENNRDSLIAVAREKGLRIYQRKLNRSGSRIIYEKVE